MISPPASSYAASESGGSRELTGRTEKGALELPRDAARPRLRSCAASGFWQTPGRGAGKGEHLFRQGFLSLRPDMQSVQCPTQYPATRALRHHAPHCGPRPLTGALWPRPRCAPWEACAGERPSQTALAPADQMRRLRHPLSRNSPYPAAPPTRVHKPFQRPALRMENTYLRLGSHSHLPRIPCFNAKN